VSPAKLSDLVTTPADRPQESVIQWDEALSSVRNVLEGWLEVQARWGHLAPLFGPSGLSSQLPLEVRSRNRTHRYIHIHAAGPVGRQAHNA
jgi:hypothetical protein